MECKNCHTSFSDETNYCPSCGGKVIRNRLTLKMLFAHFSEQFLNYDNKFLKTFLHLFTKPEEVIDGYINGTRKRYVNVISYFAIAITVSGLQIFVLKKIPGALDFSSITGEEQQKFMQDFMNKISEYQSLLMMLYIPILALMSKIVFFNIKKYNYTEHLVIFMYIIAQTTIVSSIVVILFSIFGFNLLTISSLMYPFVLLYSAYCLKRLYKFNLSEIVLKTFLFIPVLLVFYVAFSILATAIYYAVSPETFQQMIDVQK